MSALISAASPEKMDGNAKLRATSLTMNIHQQSSPLSYHKYIEIHHNEGNKNMAVNRLYPVQRATYSDRNQKWEKMNNVQ